MGTRDGASMLRRRKGAALLDEDFEGQPREDEDRPEDCPSRAARRCELHLRAWARFCKTRNVGIVSLGTVFYVAHAVLILGAVVLLATYRWPQSATGSLTAAENETLCTELNFLTTSYWCNMSVYANRSVIPYGFVTGCEEGSDCSTQLHDEACLPGTTGRVFISQPNASAAPFDYTVVFRGTVEALQWQNNFDWRWVPWFGIRREQDAERSSNPHVSQGFFDEYRLVSPGVTARLMEEVGAHRARLFPRNRTAGAGASLALMDAFGPRNLSLTVLGHSLGCPLATMFAMDAENQGFAVRRVLLASPPRLGNAAMARLIERRLGDRAMVLMNAVDLVLSGPPVWNGFRQPNLPVALVSYDDSCMRCLRSLWLNWPGAASCGELCARSPSSLQRYDPVDVNYFLDSIGGGLSKFVEGQINHDGQWTRHRSSAFAEMICPAVGREALRWPPKSMMHPQGQA